MKQDGAMVKADGEQGKRYRFVQLYTSKSYENRRGELVNPPESDNEAGMEHSNDEEVENLQKHALSPRLVDAISKSAQVVWANTKKQEGLIGRSEMRLQTAVGMPVAMDANGNMCIVVMFSPNNIQSTDDAMEYLQSISQSATSSSIPCLLPVFDPRSSSMKQLPPSDSHLSHPEASSLGEGVTARFVSLEDNAYGRSANSSPTMEPEIHSEHELFTAPKDTFGIPMLPTFAELGGDCMSEENAEIFDEASYGVWTTIMESLTNDAIDLTADSQNFDLQRDLQSGSETLLVEGENQPSGSLKMALPHKVALSSHRKERLEEFCNAFLGMSVFDMADVWVPAGGDYSDCLRHVMTVTSTATNQLLNGFKMQSEITLVKFWSGAVGRAFSSGNPVWSANSNVFVDAGRAAAFQEAKIMTVLAVPVYSGKATLPTCVVSCYSLVRSGSVPFVLRFVQQALRMLWDGLDVVEPHESVEKNVWRDIGPADLGEMAADVEMQQHFMTKQKRPRGISMSEDRLRTFSISEDPSRVFNNEDSQTNFLSMQLQAVNLPNGETIHVPLQLSEDLPMRTVPKMKVQNVQSHLYEAIRSVGQAVPFVDHIATNAQGSKRAHVMGPIGGSARMSAPLPPPRSLPSQVVGSSYTHTFQTPLVPQQPPQQAAASYSNLKIAPFVMPQQQTFNAALGQTQYGLGVAGNDNAFCADASGYMNGTISIMPPPPVLSSSVAPVILPVDNDMDTNSASSSKGCRIEGCGDPAVTRRPYCVKHSGNRLCENSSCSKCAQGSTRYCIAHGGGRRCTFPGCDKGARDKFFCAAHGGGKRCKEEGCNKSAVGGSSLCTAHGGGRRCAIDGCDKSAQSSTKFCVKHGGGKKCAHESCEKVARGRTQYCAAHGGGVRCKLEGCNRVAIGRLQLCRAHGGGSRKKGAGSERSSPTFSEDSSSYIGPGMGNSFVV